MRFLITTAILTSLASVSSAADLPNPILPSDFPTLDTETVALGRQLFFDPVLSGNDNIACATCHHPALGTGDAMSLSIGEGGLGLGRMREVVNGNAPKARIPRNAPALFNLGAREFSTMFHDGRVQLNREAMYGIAMPEGRTLERPLTSALAAQNILPILSHDEMAGHPGENSIADAIDAEEIHGPNGAWQQITAKVEAIEEYRMAFDWIIGQDTPLHITDIGNALSQFITYEFRATDSPFDQYLNGKETAMTPEQLAGMEIFYGKGNCSSCHSGKFQTDHGFHAIGLPQFGPGKDDAYADAGRGMISGIDADKYRFRTPSLRNVTLSAPYGHNGAYTDLRAMVRHHLDPFEGLGNYDRRQAALHELGEGAKDWEPMDNLAEVLRIAMAAEIEPVALTEGEIDQLMAFLSALEDPISRNGRLGVPDRVPSDLPLDPISDPS
ncbi:cytochrome-c peroxidase [Planktotalea sp.]|uniref:cytochrome-c peroxidase n=1 Tax=Planktotalea sp. TaxID=2029877 RepID=UPI003D6B2519